ncbi:MAG: L-lactate permease [Vicinamibacterales bacterium]
MEWIQVYDPLRNEWLSTLVAALPIVGLLVTLAFFEWRAQWAALTGLTLAFVIAVAVYGMPARSAAATAVYGAAYGLFPIGWIILNAIFLYNIAVASGTFDTVKRSVAALSPDRRIQALLIAFSFGAFIEGAAGFGTPVAICAALLMGLGFTPLYAAGLALIANTSPVAFGALGTPILTLGAVTGLDPQLLSAMAGRQLPLVSLIVPAWLVATMSGWNGLRGVWPAVLVSGGSFAAVQFAWSNYVGPELVDIMGGLASIACLTLFCRVWRPAESWDFPRGETPAPRVAGGVAVMAPAMATRAVMRAWVPWMLLSVFVTIWGLTPVKAALTRQAWMAPAIDVPALHRMVFRDAPIDPEPARADLLADAAYKAARAEPARFTFNYLSATGTAILLTALATGLVLRLPGAQFAAIASRTAWQMRWPLTTIAFMLSLGFVTRYSGTDATLGLAFTHTGGLYPFFAAMLGWLGVALTGSDTSSNVLFGNLQKITAQQLGLDPILITTANSTGGVMGKMIDAQSIVVATAATNQLGSEGRILRFVFRHSVVLAAIMGLIVLAQAYWFPWMIPK